MPNFGSWSSVSPHMKIICISLKNINTSTEMVRRVVHLLILYYLPLCLNLMHFSFFESEILFDRESISHGPTSLKIVLGVVQCLLECFIFSILFIENIKYMTSSSSSAAPPRPSTPRPAPTTKLSFFSKFFDTLSSWTWETLLLHLFHAVHTSPAPPRPAPQLHSSFFKVTSNITCDF